ncbi:MAG TPA: ATP-binding cassette domain-containing protein [Solirubrobacterales bacterium]
MGAGELVGLVGENGSGKSTLMQIPMVWDKLTVGEHFQLGARRDLRRPALPDQACPSLARPRGCQRRSGPRRREGSPPAPAR